MLEDDKEKFRRSYDRISVIDPINQRLTKVEDKLEVATRTLVRVDQKVTDLETRREESHERANRVSTKIDEIETQVITTNAHLATMQRVGWLILAGFITTIGAIIIDFLEHS